MILLRLLCLSCAFVVILSQMVSMPLQNKLQATLKADLNVEEMNKQLAVYIKHEVHKVEEALSSLIVNAVRNQTDLVETRLTASMKVLTSSPSDLNVAFHAYQTDSSRQYANHEIIHFQGWQLNEGGGYNPQTSIFDVPVTGVYVFTWTVVPNFWDYVQTELIINGTIKGSILADSDEIHDIHPATATVVARVNEGDHVFIRRAENSNGRVLSQNKYGRTTFSGWRLF